jgi:phosphoglycolate phosphatase-like HAD superfamily hydrolase
MLNVCIDVDLTLIDEEGDLLPGAIEALTKLREFPCELTLWSAAGAGYAKSIAARHKLEKFFAGFAGKPDLAIDDDPQSLVLRKMIVRKPEDQWDEIQKQATQALHQIREDL